MDGPVDLTSVLLSVLAEVSPSAQQRAAGLTVPLDWFRWLPALAVRLFLPPLGSRPEPRAIERFGSYPGVTYGDVATSRATVPLDRTVGSRLAAIDRVRGSEGRSLRAGFLFVAGRRSIGGGRMQRVFQPLLTVPVRVAVPVIGDAAVSAAGDVQVADTVGDPRVRHDLESSYELGGGALDDIRTPAVAGALLVRLTRLQEFAREAAAAAGFEVQAVVPANRTPEQLLAGDHLNVVAGVGLYTATDIGGLSAADSLRAWAARRVGADTAFGELYLGDRESEGPGRESGLSGPPSAYPLTPKQAEAVMRSRSEPISVVSGAAGTGKSHTVVAIACDAVARGESVLVAAKTEAAVDALVDLLEEAPGPDPVVFGSSERRERLAAALSEGDLAAVQEDAVASAAGRLRDLTARRDRLVARIGALLAAEQRLDEPDDGAEQLARLVAPRLFEPSANLEEVDRLLPAVASKPGSWWGRRRWARDAEALAALTGAAIEDLAEVGAALVAARRAGQIRELEEGGGLDLERLWNQLSLTDGRVRAAAGDWLHVASRSEQRVTRQTRAAVAVLATALRSGRAVRRAQLSRLDDRLTRALPLWVGTLGDIEDLLPARARLFDLVILDESSAIDQPLAAPALVRARRAVVVGDPHQLRHVSFLSDDRLTEVMRDHGVDDPLLAGRLDVRRNSAFDVAVAASRATVLDEHFRSAPHLVDFVARRLYGGNLHVATRNPGSDRRGCVEIVHTAGRRDEGGVVHAEVRSAVDLVRRLRDGGCRSVGIVSPFRAQADALEEAMLEAFSLEDVERLDLRVGTVHAFQGNERDVVIASLGIGADDSSPWSFVDDPHLFAVLVTRARDRFLIISSAEPPDQSLVSDYLAAVSRPPVPPPGAPPTNPWVAGLADRLASSGAEVTTSYPSGRHLVDLCAAHHGRWFGAEARVHPEGAHAHIERHLALVRAGWTLIDAYPSRWGSRPGELVVEMLSRLGVS